ncbi:uncharacterized protein LOC144432047 [Styela clava]
MNPPREKTPCKAKKPSVKSPKTTKHQGDGEEAEEYVPKADSQQYNEIVSGILPVITRNIINAITLQLPAMIGQCLEENLEHSDNSDVLTPITPNIQDILNDLSLSMRDIRVELSEIKDSQTFHTKIIYDLEENLFYVSEKLEDQERRGRLENLEFHGIPVKQNEDTDEIVCNIAKMVGVNIQASDISVSHRMPTGGEETRTPAIIAKFIHGKNKIKIFEKRKVLRSVKSSAHFSEPPKIFIAENLTALNKDLYFRARTAKNNCGYKFIWTSNGRVYVKKNADIKNSLNIRCEEDLSKIQ